MTNYTLSPILPRSILTQEKKAARKKLLEEVRARRAENDQRFLEQQKRRLQEGNDLL